jgi:DNA-binding NarL/FixJ family response regulator
VIRLWITGGSAVIREGLKTLVSASPNIELIPGEELRPDVVLAASSLAGLTPPEHGPPPAIVLLTNESEPAWSQEALRYGVRAILPRDAGPTEILAAIEAAAAGFAAVDPAELESHLAATAPTPATGERPALTARELDVLRMMADGAANKAIAWKLNISEHTVKFHVASILAKLNAGTRTEAVTIGIRKGLVLL